MVVDDFPAVFEFAENQSKASLAVFRFARDLPASEHDRRIFRQDCDFQIGKRQNAHFRARVVAFLVVVGHALPAAPDVVAGDENEIFRFPVALHKAFDRAFVPRRRLRFHNLSDVVFGFLGALRKDVCRQKKYD